MNKNIKNKIELSIRFLFIFSIFLFALYLLFPLLKILNIGISMLNKLMAIILLLYFGLINDIAYYSIIKENFIDLKNNFESIKKMKVKDKSIIITYYLVILLVALFLIYFIYQNLKLPLTILKISINLAIFIILITFLFLYYIFFNKEFINAFNKVKEKLFLEKINEIIKNLFHLENQIILISISIIILALFINIFIYIFYEIFEFIYIILKVLINLLFILTCIFNVFIYYLINYNAIKVTKISFCYYMKEIYNIIKDRILTLTDLSLRNAKKLVYSCLSEEKTDKYKQFADIVYNFRRNDFLKLLNGELDIELDNFEIINLCEKYKINDIENFKLLILKFLNFQLILCEWYEDVSKHEYLKKLWLLYPIMYKLNDLEEKELEEKLYKIDYSEWNADDKATLKRCISNSPEIKAMEFSNFIKSNLKEFNNLLNISVNYTSTFKQYKGMEAYESKCYNYIKQFVKEAINMKTKVVDSFEKIKNAIESRTIKYTINYCTKSENVNKSYDYYFNKMINSFKTEKIKNIFNHKQLLSKVDTALSFLKLSYHVIAFINCLKDLCFSQNTIFYSELEKISKNFQNHKDKIKYLSGNDKKDLELIKIILSEIQKDRNDIIELIEKINDEKKCAELEKKDYMKKTIKSALKTFGSTIFAVAATGSFSPIIGGITVVTGIIKTFKNGAKILVNIKKIDELKYLLEKATEKQNEIDEEIKQIKIIYCERESNHCPEDIKQEIIEKYS